MSSATNDPTSELDGFRESAEESAAPSQAVTHGEGLRGLAESFGFFAGACLFGWGVLGPNGIDRLALYLMWPLFAFVLPILRPRRFRVVLLVSGVAFLLISAVTRGLGTTSDVRSMLAATGLLICGACLTPRTQRALVAIRVLLVGGIVWLYVGSFYVWEPDFPGSNEPDLANAGLLFLSPLMLLVIGGLLHRSRDHLRSGRAGEWYEPSL